MVRVKGELGLTLKMASGGGFNFFRPLIAIDDIDPEKDVEAQIEIAVSSLDIVWDAVEQKMVALVERSEVVEAESVLIEVRKELASVRERLITVEQLTSSLEEPEELSWTKK